MSNIHPRKARAIREGKYHYQKPGAFNNLSDMDRQPKPQEEDSAKAPKKASKSKSKGKAKPKADKKSEK